MGASCYLRVGLGERGRFGSLLFHVWLGMSRPASCVCTVTHSEALASVKANTGMNIHVFADAHANVCTRVQPELEAESEQSGHPNYGGLDGKLARCSRKAVIKTSGSRGLQWSGSFHLLLIWRRETANSWPLHAAVRSRPTVVQSARPEPSRPVASLHRNTLRTPTSEASGVVVALPAPSPSWALGAGRHPWNVNEIPN